MDSTTPPYSVQTVPVTASTTAVSPGGPRDHAACDAEIARLRTRSGAAEGKLAAVKCRAEDWASIAPEGPGSPVLADAGRAILAIIGTEPEPRPTPAEVTRLDQMVTEHGNAVTAVREALEYAAERVRNREGTQLVVAATEALKVLSGEEGPGNG